MISLILLIIGGLNWGIVGLSHMNVVEKILGTGGVTNVVYILVGLAAIYELFMGWRNSSSGMGNM